MQLVGKRALVTGGGTGVGFGSQDKSYPGWFATATCEPMGENVFVANPFIK